MFNLIVRHQLKYYLKLAIFNVSVINIACHSNLFRVFGNTGAMRSHQNKCLLMLYEHIFSGQKVFVEDLKVKISRFVIKSGKRYI